MVLLFIWFEDTSKEAGFIFMIRFLQEAHLNTPKGPGFPRSWSYSSNFIPILAYWKDRNSQLPDCA